MSDMSGWLRLCPNRALALSCSIRYGVLTHPELDYMTSAGKWEHGELIRLQLRKTESSAKVGCPGRHAWPCSFAGNEDNQVHLTPVASFFLVLVGVSCPERM